MSKTESPCYCDRDDCKQCWAARMDDTAEIVVTPVVTPVVHDAVIDPVDVPLIVPVPHGYQEPCS